MKSIAAAYLTSSSGSALQSIHVSAGGGPTGLQSDGFGSRSRCRGSGVKVPRPVFISMIHPGPTSVEPFAAQSAASSDSIEAQRTSTVAHPPRSALERVGESILRLRDGTLVSTVVVFGRIVSVRHHIQEQRRWSASAYNGPTDIAAFTTSRSHSSSVASAGMKQVTEVLVSDTTGLLRIVEYDSELPPLGEGGMSMTTPERGTGTVVECFAHASRSAATDGSFDDEGMGRGCTSPMAAAATASSLQYRHGEANDESFPVVRFNPGDYVVCFGSIAFDSADHVMRGHAEVEGAATSLRRHSRAVLGEDVLVRGKLRLITDLDELVFWNLCAMETSVRHRIAAAL